MKRTVIYRGSVHPAKHGKGYTIQVDRFLGRGMGWMPELVAPLPNTDLQDAVISAEYHAGYMVDFASKRDDLNEYRYAGVIVLGPDA